MATATKLWAWNAGPESWSLTTVVHSTTDGSPDTGCLELTAAGRNVSVTGYADLTTGTWETLFGIPSGATVTDVQVTDGSYGPRTYCYLRGTTASATTAIAINDGGDQTIWSRNVYGDGSWQTTNAAGTNRTLSTPQAATSTVDFRITMTAATGNDKAAGVYNRLDYLTITITYSSGSTKTGTASVVACAVASAGSTKPGRATPVACAVATATGGRLRVATASPVAVAVASAGSTKPGRSSPAAAAVATATGTRYFAAPATVTVSMSGEDRYVEWDAVSGATSYVVERSVDGGAWTQESP